MSKRHLFINREAEHSIWITEPDQDGTVDFDCTMKLTDTLTVLLLAGYEKVE